MESGHDLSTLDQIQTNGKLNFNEESEVASKALSLNCKINLIIFAIAEILVGFTFSLLAPFYTQEATSKGLTVTQTGMVCACIFICRKKIFHSFFF